MIKYYTRACNFYYGHKASQLIKDSKALPLCGTKRIAFDKIQIFKRLNNKVTSKVIEINKVKLLNTKLRKKAKKSKYILQLQKSNGGSPTVSFEITESKFQSVLRLLQPEIKKRMMQAEQATSISLMDFF